MPHAILLDPYKGADGTGTIENVMYDDFRDIQRIIGCDCFTSAPLNLKGHDAFVDDNGLLTVTEETRFVYLHGMYSQPLAGRVLIVGAPDAEGNTTDADLGIMLHLMMNMRVLKPSECLVGW